VEVIEAQIKDIFRRRRNIRFREMADILIKAGFAMRQQKRGGSHDVFKHPKLEMFVVLVTHGKNDVLPEYQVLKAMRALERLSQHKDTEQ